MERVDSIFYDNIFDAVESENPISYDISRKTSMIGVNRDIKKTYTTVIP